MTEAEQITDETPEPTLEEFVAEMEADGDVEAGTDETPVEQLAEPEAEPEQMFDVNGEQVPVSELIGGYMKGADYTQKTQEIAQTREEIAAQRDALQRFYDTDATPEWEPTPPVVAPDRDGNMPEFVTDTERMLYEQNQKHEAQIQALTSDSQKRKQQEVFKSVDNTLFGFKDAHPDLPEAEIVQISQFVRQKGMPYTPESFDLVHKAQSSPSVDDIKAQARAEYDAELKANKAKSEQAALEPGSVPATSEEPPDINSLSEAMRDKLMAEEFRSMGG